MRLIDADALNGYKFGLISPYAQNLFHKIINEAPTIDYKRLLEQELCVVDWIPISKLPEDGTWNIFTDGKTISVERFKADGLDHFFPNGRWFEFEDAIGWIPLPSLYKAESEV